ncbi:hypothetical protein ACS125_18615 [Acinetobacter sp. PFS20]|uniref:hypothetical protein n=1 Tax=Acinetobacter sp. PFS20 TaxID=3458434 RepID=UPI003FD33490
MCSLDWGIIKDILVALISAGIPSLVAWKIYNGWNNQKGTEVLAIEAKEVIINLSKLQSLQCEMHEDIFYNNFLHQTDNTMKIEYESIYKKLSNSLNFLGFAVKDGDLKNYSSLVLSQAILFLRDIERMESSPNGGSINIKLIDPSDAYILTLFMLDLALYKKLDKKT